MNNKRKSGFNLVIEVLLISSMIDRHSGGDFYQFQSRNRGSFDFKSRSTTPPVSLVLA